MRILHLYSDWKWTGPAECALDLCVGLRDRGVDLRLACSPLPFEARDTLAKHAAVRGIEVINEFQLPKHFRPIVNCLDARRLARYIDAEEIDILHCHRRQDHWIGAHAARRARRRVPVVRTCHDGVPQSAGWRNNRLYRKLTDRLIAVSESARAADAKTWGLGERAVHVPPPVDTDRFRPDPNAPDLRKELDLDKKHVVFGIVARIQEKRRFDLLFEAFDAVRREHSEARMVLVGRGTKMEEVAVEPVRRMELDPVVRFAGYRVDDYEAALRTFDGMVFLVPGSDGSCRAVRQGMATGLPCLVTPRGILPELVEDGVTGLVAEESAEGLAAGMRRLLADPGLRDRMGEAARAHAEERFALPVVAARVEGVYREILDG